MPLQTLYALTSFCLTGLEYLGGEGIENVGGAPRIYLETLEPNNDKEFTYYLESNRGWDI